MAASGEAALPRPEAGARAHSAAEAMPSRLVDYMVVLGADLSSPERVGVPTLEARFPCVVTDVVPPRTEHADAPLPRNLGMFAFPSGLAVRESMPPAPSAFPFVLTKLSGARQFAYCLSFWEPLEAVDAIRLHATLHARARANAVAQMSSSASSPAASSSGSDSDSGGDDVPPPLKRPDSTKRHLRRQSSLRTGRTLFAPRAIVLLTHWGDFHSFFRQALGMLYRVSLSAPPLPLERFVGNLVCDVPVPPRGHTRVVHTAAGRALTLARPPPNRLPFGREADAQLAALFRGVSLEGVLYAWAAVLTERKLVVVAPSDTAAVYAIEALLSLAFPLAYQGVYLPLLPAELGDFLESPVPYVAGIHSGRVHLFDLPTDQAVVVRLDRGEVLAPGAGFVPALPDHTRTKLLKALRRAVPDDEHRLEAVPPTTDVAFPNGEHLVPLTDFAQHGGASVGSGGGVSDDTTAGGRRRQSRSIGSRRSVGGGGSESPDSLDGAAVRQAFLRAMEKMLLGYGEHFSPAAGGRRSFDRASFVAAAAGEDERAFLGELTQTQTFSNFIQERSEAPPAGGCPDVRFFDECLAAKEARYAKTKVAQLAQLAHGRGARKAGAGFLDSDAFDHARTYISAQPDATGVPPGARHTYKRWPSLKAANFGPPRHVRPLVAETQLQRRQARAIEGRLAESLRMLPRGKEADGWDRTLRAILTIQRCVRSWLARRRAAARRAERARRERAEAAAGVLQRSWRRHRSSADRRWFLASREAARALQAAARARLAARGRVVARAAARTLQAAARARLAARRLEALAAARRLLARRASAWAQRRRFERARAAAARIQALVRGRQARRRHRDAQEERAALAGRNAAARWAADGRPLAFRAAAWAAAAGMRSPLARAAALEACTDAEALGGVEPGWSEAEERALLYECLRRCEGRERAFALAGIGEGEKKRKRRVSQLVWRKGREAEAAADAEITLLALRAAGNLGGNRRLLLQLALARAHARRAEDAARARQDDAVADAARALLT